MLSTKLPGPHHTLLQIRPQTRRLRACRCIHTSLVRHESEKSGSAKLFADAAAEESAEAASERRRSSVLTQLESAHENWTGDEPMEHAVLRMLVDKYKPLRTGTVRTAEEKIKQTPPPVTVRDYANVPLLPSIEGHRPWHTTFKAPSHDTPSIRLGNLAPLPPPTRSPVDERARRKEKEAKKRTERVGRLTTAREATLDYKLGVKSPMGEKPPPQGRPNPVSLRGWTSLIEDKIEKARKAGQFSVVKGRGQPLVRHHDEGNPFIAREEFLMNRIIQRNGAAPPWVEVQAELEAAVSSFREIVRQAWARRAIRTLTMSRPAAALQSLTAAHVSSLRDEEWEARERAYHDTAIDEINSLVRKYNGVAPYAVRRPYHVRTVELEKAYQEAVDDILRGLAARVASPQSVLQAGPGTGKGHTAGEGSALATDRPLRILDIVRGWLAKLTRGQ
ncbi:hypothetical protein PLICRDRAFT_98222 [Plicaturopsis crispa FD-325 SS-3]|nr:hypothetical protein PLICRDRAFT_98222 [Plicaturopsis crispa FD-325 SS-3]